MGNLFCARTYEPIFNSFDGDSLAQGTRFERHCFQSIAEHITQVRLPRPTDLCRTRSHHYLKVSCHSLSPDKLARFQSPEEITRSVITPLARMCTPSSLVRDGVMGARYELTHDQGPLSGPSGRTTQTGASKLRTGSVVGQGGSGISRSAPREVQRQLRPTCPGSAVWCPRAFPDESTLAIDAHAPTPYTQINTTGLLLAMRRGPVLS